MAEQDFCTPAATGATTTRVITYTYDPLSRLTGADYSTSEQFEYAHTLAAPFDSAQGGLSAGTADGLRVAQSVIPSVDTFVWDWASSVPGQCAALG